MSLLNNKIFQSKRNKIIALILLVLIILGGIVGFIVWNILSARTYVEDSTISATVTSLAPAGSGTLQEVFVTTGEYVHKNDPVARVGNELIKAKSDGQILTINTNIGGNFSPAVPVATMIDPSDLRVIGLAQEDKGLKDVQVGQTAIFTVDAFGGKEYSGIVDEVSPTSNTGDIVFNISDTRQEMKFKVKVRFNIDKYPELRNGMSAKLWIYK